MHAVDEKHVRGGWLTKERARSFRETCTRMTREIARPTVRFGLDDARDAFAKHDARAHERTRNDERVTREERSLESHYCRAAAALHDEATRLDPFK